MKIIIYSLGFLLLPIFALSQQYTETGWLSVNGASCLTNSLICKIKYQDLDVESSNNYRVVVTFKNNFTEKIWFTYYLIDDGKEKGNGRSNGVNPGDTYSMWFHTVENAPKVYAKYIRFIEDKGAAWECDELTGVYYQPEGNSNNKISTAETSENNQNGYSSNSSYNNSNTISQNTSSALENKQQERNKLIELGNKAVSNNQFESALSYYEQAQKIHYVEGTQIAIRGIRAKINEQINHNSNSSQPVKQNNAGNYHQNSNSDITNQSSNQYLHQSDVDFLSNAIISLMNSAGRKKKKRKKSQK